MIMDTMDLKLPHFDRNFNADPRRIKLAKVNRKIKKVSQVYNTSIERPNYTMGLRKPSFMDQLNPQSID